MNTLSVRLRYRPLRLGWCVLKDDMRGLRRALRWSYTLWGGSFNPVIPVDNRNLAAALVRLFRVDALVAVSEGAAVESFLAENPHLPWPMIGSGVFVAASRKGRTAAVADIRHPLASLYDSYILNNAAPVPLLDMHQWDDNDPLADIFLATYGAYPPVDETGQDYAALARSSLLGVPYIIPNGGELGVPTMGRDTIATLCRTQLARHHAVHNDWDEPGFYVGASDCFDDLVNFWNLRAADVELEFLDVRYADRINFPVRYWADRVRHMPRPSERPRLALWHRADHVIDKERDLFGNENLALFRLDEMTWNGSSVRAPIMYFSDTSTLASIDESGKTPAISFATANRPFIDDVHAHRQHYVLSIDPGIGLFGNERATLRLPFVPELNEYFGREAYGTWNAVRSEPDSLGIITSISRDHQRLRAIDVRELMGQIFSAVGIEAKPSEPGLVATTLIRQMGGLDGCRPFKIAGVRSLIENHRPDQSFSRSAAMQTIRGQGGDRPLSEYQWLYITRRDPGVRLTNDSVLAYLLEKGVFRAGLEFVCPSCQLTFWRSLDESRSRMECDYCGHGFNVTPQLRDKDWAFRRSGLFGNADHQQGAIPVLLTLQQLMHPYGTGEGVFTTALSLAPKGVSIPVCETDFAIMVDDRSTQRIEIAIGECKSRQCITAADVANLKAVAEAFPADRYMVYLVFARLTPFSAEEIELIKRVNGPYRLRAIMLTERELEPYFPYEHTVDRSEVVQAAASFADMAATTSRVFLGG